MLPRADDRSNMTMMPTELWELGARESVRNIVNAYAVAGDGGRIDDVAKLFTEDGVLELKAPGGTESAVGQDAIAELLRVQTERAVGSNPPGFFLRHHVSTVVIESVTPSRVTGVAYFAVYGPDGPDHWGRYRDVFAPVDNRWLFCHRTVRVDAHATPSWFSRVFLD
jgi:hypothetical protein